MFFVVRSYDDDQQQSFCDVVEAKDASEANAKVSEVRDYAVVTEVQSIEDARAEFNHISNMSPDDVRRGWAETLKDNSMTTCPKCGAVYGDYLGECPKCGADNPEVE